MLKIVCVGPQWRGSNAGALFKAFSRLGHVVDVVDENYHINLSNRLLMTKVMDKLFFYNHCLEFNRAIEESVALLKPDLVLVYKGAFVLPETLTKIKKTSLVVNVYPDVSFKTHGKYLPHTLPLYDWIFTTKTFGVTDLKNELGVTSVSFIPHGFDPELHRPLQADGQLLNELRCDVSFIGTHSFKKEKYLSALVRALPQMSLAIWGNGWERASSAVLKNSIRHKAVVGDLYALAINSSLINLGILSEAVGGSSSGDLITSRTFHIPASGGFLLHERTRESVLYYKEGEESAFFEGEEELVDKVRYYLAHSHERDAIRVKGMQRAHQEHAIDERAKSLLKVLDDQRLTRST
jgi:spore maturation protein CgeB